jgi:uncharacterized protein YjeT (DUF2065 family)
MQTSYFIAQILGPTLVIMGVGLLATPDAFRETASEFLRSRALIYLAGLLALVPGLAIVLTHNVWVTDWRVLITIFGWLAVIGGAFRIMMPKQVARMGTVIIAHERWIRGAGAGVTALGAVLSFFGYF